MKPSKPTSAVTPLGKAAAPLNTASNLNKPPTKLGALDKLAPPTFKSGAALPSVSDLSSAGKENLSKKGVKF